MSEEVEEGFDLSRLDPNPQPEPDPEPEVEPEEQAEPDQVDEVEDTEELPEAEPQSDPEPKTSDLMDKELQQIQQLRATLSREVDKLQKQGDRPTEKQVDRVNKAQSKLDKYLDARDVDPYEGVSDIAEEVLADRGRAEEALQKYEGKIRAMEEREAQREAQMARLQFAADFPDLRGRYDEFASKTQEFMHSEYGEDLAEMPSNVFVKIANREFSRLVKEASAPKEDPKPESKPPKDSAKKPKATRPIPKKSGGTVESPQDSEAKGEALIAKLNQSFFGS